MAEGEGTADYSTYYGEANLRVPDFVHGRLDELVAHFEADRVTGEWLDVGCGAGALVEAAARGGWRARGTEVSEPAVRELRSRGLDVLSGPLESHGLAPESFDVVSMVEVVEHLAQPGALVREASRLLRPGGVLYLTTPHARGVSARLLGTRWSVVAPPEHLQLFSVAGVRALIGSGGLAERYAWTHAVNPTELLAAVRRRRGHDRVASGYRVNEALVSNRAGALAKDAVNAVLSVTRLGDAIKLVAVRVVAAR